MPVVRYPTQEERTTEVFPLFGIAEADKISWLGTINIKTVGNIIGRINIIIVTVIIIIIASTIIITTMFRTRTIWVAITTTISIVAASSIFLTGTFIIIAWWRLRWRDGWQTKGKGWVGS